MPNNFFNIILINTSAFSVLVVHCVHHIRYFY